MDEQREWSDKARCRNFDPKLFDTSTKQGRTVVTKETERAQEICLGCPVMMDCLIHAAFYEINTGIWGGLTPEERDAWAAREGLVA